MDPKGRVVLPARLRDGFDGRAYVSCYLDGCLAVWTADEFERRYVERARRLERRGGREGRDMARAMASQTSYVDIDQQGRLTVAPNLRDYARLELERPVKIVGVLDHVELWEPGRWRDRLEPGLGFLRSGNGVFEGDNEESAGVEVPRAPEGAA